MQPSTPGAYIDTNDEALTPFIESKEAPDGKQVIKEDKFSKFDGWLND